MMGSQIVFTTIISFILYKTIRSYREKRLSRLFLSFWILLWVIVLYLVYDQSLLSSVAHMLGIGRGVDSALYLSVILLFYSVYLLFGLVFSIEQKLTTLVRQEALKTPRIQKRGKKQS